MTKKLRLIQSQQRDERTGLLGLSAVLLQGLADILTGAKKPEPNEEIPAGSEFLRRLNEEIGDAIKDLDI